MANYFSVEELCKSDTAKKKGIDNTPSKETIENLKELIAFISPIREAWGSPLKVTSGYRSPELNKAVGGVATSSHLYGWAVDLQPVKGTTKELFQFIRGYLAGSNQGFGQLLMEHSGSTTWVHLSIRDRSGQKREVKEMYV